MKPDILLLTLQNDMLVNILNYASDIGKCSERITVQIREIIGARIVALFELNPMGEYRLLATCPERRADFFSTEEGRRLIASAGHFTQAASLEPGHGETGEMLAVLGMKESYVVPLRVGEESFGLLILLDLMDDRGAAKILEVLHDISGVLSLVFKNSYLYRNMESLVEERTKALQESELRSRMILQTAMDGFWRLDTAGRLLEVNEAYSRMSGYDNHDLIGMYIDQLEAKQTRGEIEAALRRVQQGEFLSFESVHRRKDGSLIDLEVSAQMCDGSAGSEIFAFLRDITERKRKEEELQKIKWMLTGKPSAMYSEVLGYGDMTAQNRDGLISRSIDKATLRDISSEYLDLLETSSAIYEKNGDYAFGIFCSGWCRLLDSASQGFCFTEDNDATLASGKRFCRESCWRDGSKRAIECQSPVDIECDGGIHLYSVPIFCAGEVIGAINFGYGDPPKDDAKLRSLADSYGLDPDQLTHEAHAYASRPSFIIELAKQRLLSSARLIGIMVERKLAEESLKEQRDFSESLVDTAQVIILVLDTQGRIVRFNPFMEKLVGYALDEVKGLNWFEKFLPPEIDLTIKTLFQKTVTNTLSSGNVNPIIAKDGRTILVEWNNKTLSDKDGNIVGMLAIGQDITERKKTEEALLDSERQISSIFRSAPVGIGSVVNRVMSKANNRLCEMTGYDETDLIGQSSRILYPTEEEFELVGRAKYARIAKHGTGTVETRWQKNDGSIIDVLLSSTPVNLKNHSRGVTFTALDITERKRAEEALVRQQRSIQLNHQIANVFLTSSRNEVFADVLDIILNAMDSRFGYFGYIDEAGDLVCPSLTRDVWDQCQVSDKSIVFPRVSWGGLWGRSLMEQQTLIANENLQVPEGHVALKNVLATPIVFNNNLIGQFVVANKAGGFDKDDRDLLESAAAQTAPILFAIQEEARQQKAQEKLEAQLHQAQKMESVGRLAGGVAHDYNNMLGVILGYTELAMERIESREPLYTDLKKIQGAAQRSADLTRQLLAFARKQTVSPKVIDLNDTIESILKLLLRLIGEDIDLAWKPGRGVWLVKIDPTQVDQILTNLCVNARDAIVETGKITVETSNVSFDKDYCARFADVVPGEYVLLAVSDNGCGIDEETQAHLFEPFFTTKEIGKGTGLGLAMVYGVVKQNNGFINVYSELGQGTTFKIYLPRYLDKTVILSEKEPDKPGERGHETILLVEDEPAILEMSTIMLERLGYTVLAAGTPGEAVRLAQENQGHIDLLLTDVVMPEMNGRDLAKNLLPIYPNIRRLFMSGYTANVIAHHGVLDQGVHFIQKPFSMKDLGDKLREALED